MCLSQAWNALLAGRKWWFLWPHYCHNNWIGTAMTMPKSAWAWAMTSLPKLRGKVCAPTEFMQVAGQVVYVPSGWAR